jgi:Dolichyl-phosphate-mannose-protein mannosyltransferase
VLRRLAADRALLALGAIVLGSTVARFLLSRGVDAPWIAPDEQLYGLLGRSLVAGDGLKVLGQSVPYYSLLYPLLVGLPTLWSDAAGAVTWVQALQALLMSVTAIPAYLWARPLAGPRYALLAAGLCVLIPGLVYSGLLMSEALYYPVATLAVWALALTLAEPTLRRQAFLLGAVGLALLTRLQAVGFAGAIVIAIALLALTEGSRAPFRRMRPTLAALGVVAVAWIGSRIALGGVGQLLGAYAPLAHARAYSLTDIARSIAWQTGALVLFTLAIPLVALAVLTWDTLRRREPDVRVRALVAAAAGYLAATVIEVSAFASRFVQHVTERQLLSIFPPLFVVFVVWLKRGAPRPQPLTSLATFVIAASVLLLPLSRVTVPAAYADSPSAIPLERLSHYLSESALQTVYACTAAAVLLLAVLLPGRFRLALAAVVAVGLVAISLVASLGIRDRSHTERVRTFAGAPADWIDATGANDVALLLTGDRFWPSAWETLYWNRAITKVVRLRGTENPGVVPQDVVAPNADGRLATSNGDPVDTRYVAAPTGVAPLGDPVTTLPASFEQPGMVLWRTRGPLALSYRIAGFKLNGDVYGHENAVVKVFRWARGHLELTLLGKQGLPTRILVNGQVAAQRAIPPGTVWRPSVAAPPEANGSGTCVFTIASDGLIGSTRVEFVRG